MKTYTSFALSTALAITLPVFSFAQDNDDDSTVTMSQLPAAVQKGIKETVGDAEIVQIEKQTEDDSIEYDVVVIQGEKETEMKFDASGKFLKSEEEKADKDDKDDKDDQDAD